MRSPNTSSSATNCKRCGKCAELCAQGVHVKKAGYKYFGVPKNHLCFGPKCEKKGNYCVTAVPHRALRIQENPMLKALGDFRWPAEMILATWKMAETGDVPPEITAMNSRPATPAAASTGSGSSFRKNPLLRSMKTRSIQALCSTNAMTAVPRSKSMCPGTAAGCRSARSAM